MIHFQPLLFNILINTGLTATDVFLFEPTGAAAGGGGGGDARYIAHFESGPPATAPNLTAGQAQALLPGNITGDLVRTARHARAAMPTRTRALVQAAPV